MNAKLKETNNNTQLYKEIASEIVWDINEKQGANLGVIAEKINQNSSLAFPKLKDALLGFIETYIERKSFSVEDMQERIDRYSKIFAKHRLHEIRARATLLLASHYKQTYKHYSECLDNLNKVELIAQRYLGTNSMLVCMSLFEKGGVYYFQGDFQTSTEVILQAQSMKVFSKASPALKYMSHINLSRNYILMDDGEKAKKHLEYAEIAWEDYQGITDKAALYMRKSDMFRIDNDWDNALELLQEGLEFYKGTNSSLRIAEFHKEIGEFYHRPENPLKDFKLAMNAFNEALIIAEELKILRLQAAIYNSMWIASKFFEEWKLCADYMMLHSKVEEQVHREELNVYIKKLEHHTMLEKQKMVQQGKPSFSDMIIDEVVDLRQENESLKKRNAQLRKIMTDIELLIDKKSHNGNGIFLEQLHKTIQKGKNEQITLEAYLLECDKTHPEFGQSLINRIPSITAMEMKIAKLIRLGLSTQAMATLCGVTLKSIENHRIRLRKKCMLRSEQSLASFLQTLL